MSGQPLRPFEEPVRVLSDLHLAHPASLIGRVGSLRPLLEGAKTVIFNGDTCELVSRGWREEGLLRLEQLKNLCEEVGAKPVFLPGNHDPDIGSEGWCELAGGKVLVMHGHSIFDTVAPWSHEYLWRKSEVRDIVNRRAVEEADLASRWETTRMVTEAMKPKRTRKLGKKGRCYFFSGGWPPERLFNILWVWWTMTDEASRFVERFCPKAEVLLFGHFHRPGVWRRRGRFFCNSGAFMRACRPRMAELDGGWLRLHRVIREGEHYAIHDPTDVIRIGEP